MLDLLFQGDEGKIVVVIADAEFLPRLHPVELFPQGLVPVVVEIDASDRIQPVRTGVRVRLHDGPEPLAESQMGGRADLVFQLVPPVSVQFHGGAPFRFLEGIVPAHPEMYLKKRRKGRRARRNTPIPFTGDRKSKRVCAPKAHTLSPGSPRPAAARVLFLFFPLTSGRNAPGRRRSGSPGGL